MFLTILFYATVVQFLNSGMSIPAQYNISNYMSFLLPVIILTKPCSFTYHVLSLTKIIARSLPTWVSSCGEHIWSNIKAGHCGTLHQWQMEDYV